MAHNIIYYIVLYVDWYDSWVYGHAPSPMTSFGIQHEMYVLKD